MRRVAIHVLVAVAMFAAAPAAASAGEYVVTACTNGANRSWTPMSGDPGMAVYPAPTGCSEEGLVVRNVLGAAGATVPNGSAARWRFDAPAGTAITGIVLNGQFYTRGQRWQAVLSNGSQVLLGCGAGASCDVNYTGQRLPLPASSTIYTEAFCASGPCDADGLRAKVAFRSVQVILTDSAGAAISNPRGSAFSQSWIGGRTVAEFDATDASGIKQVSASIDGAPVASRDLDCDFAQKVCANFSGAVDVNARGVSDGEHTLAVEARDRAGNLSALTRKVSIDNTPPTLPEAVQRASGDNVWGPAPRVGLSWSNPPQTFAPIAGAEYEACPAGKTTGCSTGSGGQPNELGLDLPSPGLYDVRLWLRDAAGNADRQNAAPVVQVGWDADAPTDVTFAVLDPSDPSLIRVVGRDATSGIAGGSIEYRRKGKPAWRSIRTTLDGSSVIGRMPDGRLSDGRYELRAALRDAAGNERSTRVRSNGRRAAVRLPLRIKARLTVGRRVVRRGSKRRVVLVSRPRTRVGKPTRLSGRLAAPGGNPIAGAPIVVTARTDVAGAAFRPIGQVSTDRSGRFRFKVPAGPSQVVRFSYAGAANTRPQLRVVKVRVPAVSTIKTSRKRVVNGEAVEFSGRVRTGPIPDTGKLVELQFYSRGRWRTFRTTHTDAAGRWKYSYRFTGTIGRQVYRMRVHMPRESGYQYADGGSRTVRVTVQGL